VFKEFHVVVSIEEISPISGFFKFLFQVNFCHLQLDSIPISCKEKVNEEVASLRCTIFYG